LFIIVFCRGGHTDMAEKASHHFKKASIPLKMYLKSLAILEKATICLKKFSKIIEIFIYKSPTFPNRSLHFSGNVFKMPRYPYKILILI
jgi:hypothetical protein